MQTIIERLLANGVKIPHPHSVEIGVEVDPQRIRPAVIHSGCRIFGANTLIEEGAKLGFEGPVTVNNCYVGPNVELNGGYFEGAVLLKGVKAGLGAHVRPGTIMEEYSSIAHTVGLKQTILFPWVTLGSLINFCDCFMSGGTSRKNHSEVGSSYIHFNYTPSQHKATPSLLGDVPRGVMLNQPPIFLGGQGGMVGPCRLNFGITTAAGIIVRKNELNPDRLIFGSGNMPRTSASYQKKHAKSAINKQLVTSNLIYIANLAALRNWYRHVRGLFVGPHFSAELHKGLCLTLENAITERIKRLKEYTAFYIQTDFASQWAALEELFCKQDAAYVCDGLLNKFVTRLEEAKTAGADYLTAIQNLPADAAAQGTMWLQAIVDNTAKQALELFPEQQ